MSIYSTQMRYATRRGHRGGNELLQNIIVIKPRGRDDRVIGVTYARKRNNAVAITIIVDHSATASV